MSKERELMEIVLDHLSDCALWTDESERYRLIKLIKALLEKQEAEPVAWSNYIEKIIAETAYVFKDSCMCASDPIEYIRSLLQAQPFTHPQRQPVQLSDDRLKELWDSHVKHWPETQKQLINPVIYARAVIAAYEGKNK